MNSFTWIKAEHFGFYKFQLHWNYLQGREWYQLENDQKLLIPFINAFNAGGGSCR